MADFQTTNRPQPTVSQIALRMELDRFAVATGHRSVAEVMASRPKAKIINFPQISQPWWLGN